MKRQRLTRVESSLTPKQAVRFWLRQHYHDKTSSDIEQWLIQRPLSSYPRPALSTQMNDAVRAALKGQEANRVNQAVRQAQMHADFLFLLATHTNSVILHDSRCRRLRILLLNEQLRNAVHTSGEESAASKWAANLRDFAVELFSLRAAS